jgi:hypothetical protein
VLTEAGERMRKFSGGGHTVAASREGV